MVLFESDVLGSRLIQITDRCQVFNATNSISTQLN